MHDDATVSAKLAKLLLNRHYLVRSKQKTRMRVIGFTTNKTELYEVVEYAECKKGCDI